MNAILGGENAGGLITLDGRVVGDAPAAAALPHDGISYVGLHPDAPRFYGVTRKLAFEDGRLCDCPPDVRAFDWGGLYEVLLRCGELPPARERRFPFALARLSFEGALAVLYYEDGLWLSLERSDRVQTGFLLHADATRGALALLGRTLVAVAHGARDACLALNERFEPVGRIEADRVTLENGVLESVTALDSLCGYERRTRWALEGGALTAAETETGFFTRERADCGHGIRFLEALLAGRDDEAEALLSPALAVSAAETRGFLGEFSLVRRHPANPRTVGVARLTEGVTRMRALTFETEGDQIVNILEES